MKWQKCPEGHQNGGGCFLEFFKEVESIFLPSLDTKGGDSVEFITWQDLIQIGLLVFAILSVFYNKKR